MRTFFKLIPLWLLLAACGGSSDGGITPPPPPPPETPGLAKTSCGDYQGNDRGNGWSFLGIRYAAAPSGPRRWRSPESPACPSGTVTANAYAPVCPQLDRDSGAPEGDEDCLAVNVFTPKSVFPTGRKPVMVFIHGGGNVVGSAREEVVPGRLLYDGAALAEFFAWFEGALGHEFQSLAQSLIDEFFENAQVSLAVVQRIDDKMFH